MNAASRRRIIVLGYIVRGPLGGMSWHHLNYVLGFARLGHDVYYIEDSDDYASCYDPRTYETTTDPSYGLEYTGRIFQRLELKDRWAYYDAHTQRWLGPAVGCIREVCATADLVLNVSGVNPLRPWLAKIPVRALVDTDPVFTQIRHLTNPEALAAARAHTHFLTFGENFGRTGGRVPDDGLPWRRTRQPVVLDAWPVTTGPVAGPFTTVMQWKAYEPRTYQGVSYGMKSESLGAYFDLPAQAGCRMEIALAGGGAPRQQLLANGWQLPDPIESTRDPWVYQEFIRRSKAEFSVAKEGYIKARSGWFSERSACYLAAGRPVVAQDTGFSEFLPCGEGLFAFRDVGEAVHAIGEVSADYPRQCRAARRVAEEHFAFGEVLEDVLRQCDCPASR
jgi:hypothetical protein